MVEVFSVGSQAGATNTPPSKGVPNGQGTPPSDLVDLPKLKGIGRNRRARFSLYRHLQKHTMQHADSVSSVDSTGVCFGEPKPKNQREAPARRGDIDLNCDYKQHVLHLFVCSGSGSVQSLKTGVGELQGNTRFWHGKDYCNFVYKDWIQLEKPFDGAALTVAWAYAKSF